MAICCLPGFPSQPGSGSDSAHFLPAADDLLLQLLQPIPTSAGQPPPAPSWVRHSPGAAVPSRSPRAVFAAELSAESISAAAFGLGAGFMIASRVVLCDC